MLPVYEEDEWPEELILKWEEGTLLDKEKEYVISQIPFLRFVDRSKDYSKQ